MDSKISSPVATEKQCWQVYYMKGNIATLGRLLVMCVCVFNGTIVLFNKLGENKVKATCYQTLEAAKILLHFFLILTMQLF